MQIQLVKQKSGSLRYKQENDKVVKSLEESHQKRNISFRRQTNNLRKAEHKPRPVFKPLEETVTCVDVSGDTKCIETQKYIRIFIITQ